MRYCTPFHSPVFDVAQEAKGDDLSCRLEHKNRREQEVEQFQCKFHLQSYCRTAFAVREGNVDSFGAKFVGFRHLPGSGSSGVLLPVSNVDHSQWTEQQPTQLPANHYLQWERVFPHCIEQTWRVKSFYVEFQCHLNNFENRRPHLAVFFLSPSTEDHVTLHISVFYSCGLCKRKPSIGLSRDIQLKQKWRHRYVSCTVPAQYSQLAAIHKRRLSHWNDHFTNVKQIYTSRSRFLFVFNN